MVLDFSLLFAYFVSFILVFYPWLFQLRTCTGTVRSYSYALDHELLWKVYLDENLFRLSW